MSNDLEGRLREGYRTMIDRVHQLLQHAGEGVVHSLEEALLKAREQAYTLGELSREEAEVVATALKRDVEGVALTMMQAEAGARLWMETDLTVAERRLLERALASADPTTLELLRLKELWTEREQAPVHAGMEARKGAYACVACGEIIHLAQAATVPPCPRCKSTRFRPMGSAVM
ncbi:MAG: zinc ribbon-containing protein [Halothiobacillaceae bacterium]